MTANGEDLPARFTRTIGATWGEPGRQWLSALPALLEDCARRWSLTLAPPFPNLTFNYVAPVALSDGTEAVLKVGVPNNELHAEAAALRAFDGRGSVRLLESDADAGVLLLERLRPGVVLTTLADEANDDEATAIDPGSMSKRSRGRTNTNFPVTRRPRPCARRSPRFARISSSHIMSSTRAS